MAIFLIGVAVGIGISVAFGLIFSGAFYTESDAARARKKAASDQPLPRPLGL